MKAVTAVAALYVALTAWGWAPLPWHMQIADLVFPVLLALVVASSRARWKLVRLDLFLLVFVAGSALSIPGSIDARQSALDVLKEAYLFASYFVLAQVMEQIGAVPIMRWFPVSLAVTSALSLAAAAVFSLSGSLWTPFGQPMPLPYIGTVFRLAGTLDAPEFFGNLLTFAAPVGIAIACRSDLAERRLWTGALALMAAAEVLTFSKSLAGCVVAVIVMFWPDWRGLRGAAVLKVASVGIAAVLILAFNATAVVAVRHLDVAFGKDRAIPPPPYVYALQDDSGADLVQIRVAYNPMSYFLVKKAEWVAWRRAPILGIGAGTFYLEAERAYQEGRLPQSYRRIAAHSAIFGRLAETGLVGLLTLVLALSGVWRCGMTAMARASEREKKIAWGCLAGLVGLLINGINVDIMHFRFLWLGLAAIRAIDQRASENAIA